MKTQMKLAAWMAGLFALAMLVLAGCGGGHNAPDIKHVWVITLENKGFDTTWSASTQASYLNNTLRPQGAFLTHYYGIGHVSQGNYIAMISGQPLNNQTSADCFYYNEFAQTGTVDGDIAVGTGCVFPKTVQTLPDQLKARGLSWKGYMEDMGKTATREESTCGRPLANGNVATGLYDGTQSATASDQYAARHNPFVYFHSLIDSGACASNVVALTNLDADLVTAASAPNFSFITPNLCNDGHDGDGTGATGKGCKNGDPGGLTSADAFLKYWVPKIQASPAYADGGLIVITFDEGDVGTGAPTTTVVNGVTNISIGVSGESCCNQPLGPNVTRPGTATIPVAPTMNYVLSYDSSIGGGRVGAVLLSPYIKAGTTSDVPYNHYSLLKSLENFYKTGYLGYAAQSGLAAFAGDIFFGYY